LVGGGDVCSILTISWHKIGQKIIEINRSVYFTALVSLFPFLMGLDNAALRSSCSSESSSKNPREGPASGCDWRWFDFWFGILLFDDITMALEDLVVRLAETAAVNDEVVRSNEREFLASAGAPTGAPALVT
jgi:hypothetical protein